ncbi:unnamed protein product [Rhodiola kirilowii]
MLCGACLARFLLVAFLMEQMTSLSYKLFLALEKLPKQELLQIERQGRSKGFAFITFAEDEAANSALSMDGQEIDGRRVGVKIATDRPPRYGGGGGYGGGQGGGGGDYGSF